MDYRYCSACGRLSAGGGSFCTFCGSSTDKISMRICPECRRNIPADSRYCSYCGTKCAALREEYLTCYDLSPEELNALSSDGTANEAGGGITGSDSLAEKLAHLEKLSAKSDKAESISGKIANIEAAVGLLLNPSAHEEWFKAYELSWLPGIGVSLDRYKGTDELAVVPAGIRVIGADAFRECLSVTDVVVPEGVYAIGANAFRECKNLQSAVLNDGLRIIGQEAFRVCKCLFSVKLPEGLATISAKAFHRCPKLKCVTIPASVMMIGEMAFGYEYDFKKERPFKLESFRIKCFKDSAGEKYAIDNGFDYEIIG